MVPEGIGTALKPAAEHWILARKPLDGTYAENVLKHGVGGLNIDACRIGTEDDTGRTAGRTVLGLMNDDAWQPKSQASESHPAGRWPANVCLSHFEGCRLVGARRAKDKNHRKQPIRRKALGAMNDDAWVPKPTVRALIADADGLETVEAWECEEGCPVAELDRQSGDSKSTGGTQGGFKPGSTAVYGSFVGTNSGYTAGGFGDIGGASRFFYCPKASRSDRGPDNDHPTVKSTDLMRWLLRLIATPGDVVLDPFAGSGSTGKAAVLEGMGFIGIERDGSYHATMEARIAAARHATPLFDAIPAPA